MVMQFLKGNATGPIAEVSPDNPLPVTGNLSVGNISVGNVGISGPLGPQTAAASVATYLNGGNVTAIINALPAGTNVLGHVIVDSGNITAAVSGAVSSTEQGQFNYANAANWVRGTVTIGNTTAATVLAAPGAGLKNYVTDIAASNTGNATVTVAFNDSGNTILIVPSGGGNNPPIRTPLVTAGNTALTATISGNVSSVIISAGGYKAA